MRPLLDPGKKGGYYKFAILNCILTALLKRSFQEMTVVIAISTIQLEYYIVDTN